MSTPRVEYEQAKTQGVGLGKDKKNSPPSRSLSSSTFAFARDEKKQEKKNNKRLEMYWIKRM